jgi:hypothetical protein
MCDICNNDDCKKNIKYPSNGDICCCGGTIKSIGMIGYEEIYECDKCGEQWVYD